MDYDREWFIVTQDAKIGPYDTEYAAIAKAWEMTPAGQERPDVELLISENARREINQQLDEALEIYDDLMRSMSKAARESSEAFQRLHKAMMDLGRALGHASDA